MRRSTLSFLLIVPALFLVPLLTFASTSVSIGSLSPSATVSVGTTVTFTVGTGGFTNPSFSVSDSVSGSSISNGDINSAGSFSWTPTANDVGTHTLTVSVNDGSGNSGTVAETITVSNGPTLSITSLVPGYSVVYGMPLTFNVVASGFNNPIYAVGDSFTNGGSSLSNGDIGTGGNFTWIPNSNDIGQHNLTVTVVDNSGHSASQQLQVTVEDPQLTVESLTPGATVATGQQLSFKILPTGFTNPTFALSDSLPGSTLSSNNINYTTSNTVTGSQTIGQAHWIPSTSDIGQHNLTLTAFDAAGHDATDTISLVVTSSGSYVAPVVTSTPTLIVSPAVPITPVTPTLPASSATFTQYLVLGSSGGQVSALQTLLARLNFLSVSSTGYFGSATEAAVEKFQTAHSLSVTGTVGPQTRAVLNGLSSNQTSQSLADSSYAFVTELEIGSQGAAVTALQQRLTVEGDYSGAITGYFGSQTEAALEKYQTAHGLAAVGVLGPQTRADLNSGL